MGMAQNIPWPRIIAESTAIVASILLAFAIDAWWEDRLERELESQQLSRLRVELEANIELIDEFQAIGRQIDTGLRIIELIEDAQIREAEFITVPAVSLFQLTRAATLEVEISVFDGLVRSGNLEVIRDQQVVSTLAAWERGIRDYVDLAAVARTTTEMLLLPALHRRADTALALTRANPILRDDEWEGQTDVSLSIDNEIKGLIAQKTAVLSRAGRTLPRMSEAAQAAIDAIDAAQ